MRAIITVLGKDNLGIIYNVTKIVSQTIMSDDIFAMFMLVDVAKLDNEYKTMAAELKAFGQENGYSIHVQREDVFNAMHSI